MEFQDIGREIKDAVLDAVQSGDYSQLNRRITGSVGAALDEVGERLSGASGPRGPRPEAPRENPYTGRAARPAPRPSAPQEPELIVRKPKGGTSGTLLLVFGAILTGIFGFSLLAVLGTLLAGLLKLTAGIAALATVSVFLAGGAVMLGAGSRKTGRLARFRSYAAVLGGKTYCAISDLARKIGKKEAFVRRDLQKMIALGLFPQGHIDDEGKTLLLTDSLYSEYRDLKRQREETASQPPETPEEQFYRETVEKGEAYQEAIRRANDAIPGEVVSEKLDRLEGIVRKIFEQVKAHPQQIPELRRFLDYYMPTTLKLVETYQELDRQSVAGENIQRAKQEIEKTLDTINQAFENLFDKLFADTAVDISSDISVLKMMLKQEGLTDRDFPTS